MNEHIGTRDIGDSDIGGGDSSDDSVEVLNPGISKLHSAIARRAPTPPLRRNSRLNAPELVAKLANTFDPEIQCSMHEERSQRSFQTTQLMTLTQQLHDAQAATEALRNCLAEVECARDRAELKLELVSPVPFTGYGGNGQSSRACYIAEECPDLVRRGGKIRRRQSFLKAGVALNGSQTKKMTPTRRTGTPVLPLPVSPRSPPLGPRVQMWAVGAVVRARASQQLAI